MALDYTELNLKPSDKFVKTLAKKTIPGKKYVLATEVFRFEGLPYAGFFGVDMILPHLPEPRC